MRWIVMLLATLAGLTLAAPAHALNWALGANLGFFTFASDDVEDFSLFAWPSSAVYPGLRVSFGEDGSPHVVYMDTELFLLTSDGASSRDFSAIAGYQYVFPGQGALAPYLTVSGGIVFAGVDVNDPIFGDINLGANTLMLGGGLGLRHRMGNGHGTIRAEARIDRSGQGEDGGIILIPEGTAFGLKLGFDLWDR